VQQGLLDPENTRAIDHQRKGQRRSLLREDNIPNFTIPVAYSAITITKTPVVYSAITTTTKTSVGVEGGTRTLSISSSVNSLIKYQCYSLDKL
jgi:hypothetical protein